jgi:dihydropteroate synthase
MNIGGKTFKTSGKTYIMGILNVTPDSFSDGGTHNQLDSALKHTEKMICDGADIIDIGGESTRPGYTMISDSEEINRIVPVIKEIKKRFDIPVSVDTYKSKVAKAALEEGADLINDIWGLKYDSEMAAIIKKSNVPCCLMHNRKNSIYNNFIEDVLNDLKESIQIALNNNIPKDKIILDPGVGFAKSYEQNLEIINKAEKLHTLGCPLLLGTSRKSVIGLTLDLPSSERLEGTLVTSVMAVLKDYMFIRVHDVKENKRAVMMTEKILGR